MTSSSPSERSLAKRVLRGVRRVCVLVLVAAVVLVLTQDMQIFPGMFRGLPKGPPPEDIERRSVQTEDGETIEVWIKEGVPDRPLSGFTAIFMHGNFETVASSKFIQDWFSQLGIDTYTFDYRGYGNSSGWPSEAGLYRDSSAVWKLAQERNGATADRLIIAGMSIGSGIAAELASRVQPKTLLLITPYTDLPNVVAQHHHLRPLLPFLWYRLPTLEFVQQLPAICLIVAHGKQDTIIGFENSERIAATVADKKRLHFIQSEAAGHNDILKYSWRDISDALVACGTSDAGLEPAERVAEPADGT